MSDRYRAQLPYANGVSNLLSTEAVGQGWFLISMSESRSSGCHVRILLSRSAKSRDSVSEILGKGSISSLNRGLDQQSGRGELNKINACGPSKWQRFRIAFMHFAQFLIPDRCCGVGKWERFRKAFLHFAKRLLPDLCPGFRPLGGRIFYPL